MFKEFIANDSVRNQMLKKVYKLIHQKHQTSKNELLEETNIKQTTLTRMLDEMLNRNFILESGYGKSSGGRPPVLYQINEKIAYIIGIDISRIETKVILMDLFFQPIEIETFQMTKKESPQVVFSKVIQIIHTFLANFKIELEQLLGIGVGTVGPLNRQEGIIDNPEAFQSPKWQNVKVKEILSETFSVPIIVENGANTAALAEYTHHQFLYKNILYCIGGFGVRCGVISNGQFVHSKQGDSSAYGHIIIQAEGRLCTCGRKGCLTTYASFGAMLDEYKSRVKHESTSLNAIDPSILMDEFINELKKNDSLTKDIVKKAAYYYGIGIANMINVLHPELVVLHGSLIYESPYYYERVVESALKHTYSKDKDSIQFKKGGLGANGIAIGAGIQVFQTYFKQIDRPF
ncbi:ROK family protein [Bacillus sp. B15-48]|uniref:ROK family protein n=1 Tax=Bacillus sp. B15-48 TaxID=1548601 RepID=UPI00193F2882|nr:ROK family protein [Bacillus sp. B15-48]MBM4761856.1 ROK family protein [Bacillus sp. B15-48]